VEALTQLFEQAEANGLPPLEQQFVEAVAQSVQAKVAEMKAEHTEHKEENKVEENFPTGQKGISDIKAATKKLQEKYNEMKQKQQEDGDSQKKRYVKQPNARNVQ
jgi:hypothetical protein